jgi:death-on-curing protein
MFGEDLYPDTVGKAGVLFFRLARSHAFSDGNKRVALVILLDWLEQHGLELAASEDELYEWVLEAASTATREEVTEWIAARLRSQNEL